MRPIPTADKILTQTNMTKVSASKRDIRRAYRLANESGFINALDMVVTFGCPPDKAPPLFGLVTLASALEFIGCAKVGEKPPTEQPTSDEEWTSLFCEFVRDGGAVDSYREWLAAKHPKYRVW